ncbi:hypothetical protein [Barrientosiimonas humi]|uniref:hypothetical protein n=1 Tax=Barrientosiimonas humi TaxID=999931 RepID=UPI00370D7EDA
MSELTFHRKYKPAEQTYAPAALEGEDLLDIFIDWAKALKPTDTRNIKRQTWVSVAEVRRYADRVALVELRVGAYGEPGDIVNIETGDSDGIIDDNQAPTGENRALLYVPETGEAAYFLSEGSSRGIGGSDILRHFRSYFSKYTDQITMNADSVTEGEAWAAAAHLTEVEVRVQGRSADIADGVSVNVGKVSHIARPEKKQWFSGKLLKSLEQEQVLRQIVAIDEVPDDREVYVTLEHGGRTKKLLLGIQGSPAIREVLNEADEGTLDTKTLVQRCTERVSDLCSRKGATWQAAWSRPISEE